MVAKRNRRPVWRGAAGLLAAALVWSVPAAPAAASGLFENIIGGLSRAFDSAPPPSYDSAYANPDGFVPPNNPPRQPPAWRSRASGRGLNTIAGAARVPKGAPMGTPLGDPTLRPGDVVATTNGLVVYTGGRGGLAKFVPVKSYPYFGRSERSQLLALEVTPPSRRWNAEAPLGSSTTVSAWQPGKFGDFNKIRTAQR